ncbi:2-amino-4-oxopentanoate thiolase subunit OrtA [Aminipila luticellarii]|uniref:2-amino-4-ketopentanoate thiolase n=1 Tax=Aminipila luticellarii TaxID=2507160 RepID=A0A410PWL2_9FIRM|nr:2-amino-4-oxopentanoate thiolase subunit OrtA [Aminipila luticellarii]QAT43266.1 2-amino-4-ketopentanoate thiolase [Aminipila luticellarii]
MSMAKKGDWVQIENTVLKAGNRAPQVPEDTQKCDLKLWVKGIAQHEGNLGENMDIITVTGRKTSGTLVDINPRYIHDYGDFQPELLQVELQLKEIMEGAEK